MSQTGSRQDSARIIDKQQAVVRRFTEVDDPLFTYQLLIDTANRFTRLEASEKTDDRKVKGCQSQAWLKLSEADGTFWLEGDSDTLVVRGILALLAEVFNGEPCGLVKNAPMDFLVDAGVMETFDSTRRAGISKIVETMKDFAARC